MELDPYDRSLQTHKVRLLRGKSFRSSRVNGDIRILWDFADGQIRVIDLYDIGSHDDIY